MSILLYAWVLSIWFSHSRGKFIQQTEIYTADFFPLAKHSQNGLFSVEYFVEEALHYEHYSAHILLYKIIVICTAHTHTHWLWIQSTLLLFSIVLSTLNSISIFFTHRAHTHSTLFRFLFGYIFCILLIVSNSWLCIWACIGAVFALIIYGAIDYYYYYYFHWSACVCVGLCVYIRYAAVHLSKQ